MIRFARSVVVAVAGLLASSCALAYRPALKHATPSAVTAPDHLPVAFERNDGQFAPEVRFIAHGAHWTAIIGTDTITYLPRNPGARIRPIRLRFTGSRSGIRAEGADLLRGRANYLVGSDHSKWRRNVPTYATVILKQVYRGIDVVLYGRDGDIEYDLQVAPGASVAAVSLEVDAEAGELRDGEVAASAGSATLRMRAPIAFQLVRGSRVPVPVGYVRRHDGTFGIAAKAADPSLPLTVDPVLVYSYPISISPVSLAVASDRGVYLAGAVLVGDPICWADDVFKRPCADIVVQKLSPDGASIEFTLYLGGTYDDTSFSIHAGPDGKFYLHGTTASPDFAPLPAGVTALSGPFILQLTEAEDGPSVDWAVGLYPPDFAVMTASDTGTVYVASNQYAGGKRDIRVDAISPDGVARTLQWMRGAQDDNAHSIDADAAGNVYIAGMTTSADFPVTPNAFQKRFGSGIVHVSGDLGRTAERRDAGLEKSSSVSAFVFDAGAPDTVYAATNEAIFKSPDAGKSWATVTVPQGRLFADPVQPNTLYSLCCVSLIRKSIDGGATWVDLARPNDPFFSASGLLIDGATGALYLTDNHRVYRSVDGGATWTDPGWFTGCGLEILAITTTPHRIVLRRCEWNDGAFSRLFVSTDNGTAFRQMGADFDVYLGANPAAVYIVRTTYVNNVAMRQLLRSTDDGASFSPVAGIDPTFQSVRIDPFADRLIVLFSTSAVASADGGQTWEPAPGVRGSSYAFSPSGLLFFGAARKADCFLTKLAPDGAVQFSTFLGGDGTDDCSLEVTASGESVLTGMTLSPDFPGTTDPDPVPPAGRAFMVRMPPDGSAPLVSRLYTDRFELWRLVDGGSNVMTARRSGSAARLELFDRSGSSIWTHPLPLMPQQLDVDAAGATYLLMPSNGGSTVQKFIRPTLLSLTADAAMPAAYGAAITWTADADAVDVEYQFWRFDAGAGWTVVRDWSTSPQYMWVPGQADQGQHHLQVWIRGRGTVGGFEDWRSTTFSIVSGAPPTVTELSSNAAAPYAAGVPVTWTATATAGARPTQYQFWRRDADGWHLARDYAAANTYTWTPAPSDIGAHALQVWVRNQDSAAAYEDYAAVTFEVRAPDPLAVTSLTPDGALPSPAGRPLVWTATTSGGVAPLQYRFWRLDADGWHLAQDYGPSNTYTWTPGPGDIGAHALQAWVRSAGSVAAYDAWTSVSFSITAPAPVSVPALGASVALPAPAGSPITWTASATGGLAPLQYKFWRLDADGWHMAQDYSTQTAYSWTPDAAQVGSHAIQVWVRGAGSVAAYDNWRGVTFTVAPPPSIAITSFTANIPLPATVGTPITWTATATGGAAPLEYQFWRLDNGTWSIAQPYSATSTYSWTPAPGDAGTHAVQVWVRSSGSAALYEAWQSTGLFIIGP